MLIKPTFSDSLEWPLYTGLTLQGTVDKVKCTKKCYIIPTISNKYGKFTSQLLLKKIMFQVAMTIICMQ